MILSSGKKVKKGIGEIQATGEILTARAGTGFVSQYIESQKWSLPPLSDNFCPCQTVFWKFKSESNEFGVSVADCQQ